MIRDGQRDGEFVESDAEQTMFVLAVLLDGMAPLLAVKAKGVTRERVERTWLAEASRLLGRASMPTHSLVCAEHAADHRPCPMCRPACRGTGS